MTQESERAKPYDRLLTGGHVIDPANGIDGVMDVAITGKNIALVAPAIPAEQALEVIDVSGLYVTPGILDIHTHTFKFLPDPGLSYIECVNPEAHLFASGVTTTVDVGTAGWQHFMDFKSGTIERVKVRVLAMVNIARGGMVNMASEQEPEDLNPQMAAAVAKAFPEIVVGIKTAHYWTSKPWDEQHQPWLSVDNAVEAGELSGLPVMVDFWPRPPERPYSDLLLKHLRPGDIHTHVFAQQFPILENPEKVNDFMFAARERGIRFDLGHGAASFWFRNAAPAYRCGFPPDSISTDLHMGNINGPVASMANTMSKFLNIGMPLNEVIFRSTVRPAELIHRPALGTLSPGAEADIAVFDLRQGSFSFADCGKARISGPYKLECQMTLRAGAVVYNPYGLGLPEWEQAPAPYWKVPDLQ
jgi:dihydroorotase